jgi:cell division protein FtsB
LFGKKFILTAIVGASMVLTISIYVGYLLYLGKNSYKVYSKLQKKKLQLKYDIKRLQYENASLQKKYLELKNLEPEEL